MRIVRGNFLIAGSLTGAIAVTIGAVATGLSSGRWLHVLREAAILLCIVPPILGLAFASAVPIRRGERIHDDRR